jgi:hypothetical protein
MVGKALLFTILMWNLEQRRAKSLGQKSTLLANSLTEESPGLEGTAVQERMDEIHA